jgi:glucokinase
MAESAGRRAERDERMRRLLLCVDAGGTSVRFRLSALDRDTAHPLAESRRSSSGWEAFRRDLALFLESPEASRPLDEHADKSPRAAVFALAGVVDGPAFKGSVTRWGAERLEDMNEIAGRHGFTCIAVLNDLEAANLAVLKAPNEAVGPLDGGEAPPRGSFVHIMPGTGLGVGVCVRGRSMASEAGSAPCAFDSEDADEIILAKALRKETGLALPTYETALCAKGLSLMAGALSGEQAEPELITGAFTRERRFGREIGLYTRLLARAAQSAALMALPETCFLSGVIVNALPTVVWEAFAREFRRHAVQGPFLSRVRLARVDETELALKGAEHAARQAVQEGPR